MRASLDALALLLEEDDQFFSEQLPDFLKTAQLGPHADLLWHPRVFARLCGLSDAWFTATVLTLAQPEYLGLDLLFDDRLLPRLATMRNGHLRGTFLPYARRIKGFDARDFLRELRRTQQAADPPCRHRHTRSREYGYHQGDPGHLAVVALYCAGETYHARRRSRHRQKPAHDPGRRQSQSGPSITGSGRDSHAGTGGPTHDSHALDRRRPGGYPEATARKERTVQDQSPHRMVDANGEEHVFTFAHMPVLERTLQEYQPRVGDH